MEHISWYIYLYSIYSNITMAIGIAALTSITLGIIVAVTIWVEELQGQAIRNFRNAMVITAVITSLLSIVTPEKEQLLLIFAADPAMNAVIDSYQNGKLKKVDQLLDLSLDKAIKAIQENK